MLLAGILFGCLAAASYIWPGFIKDQLGFISMRPLHVSSALFWILLGATSCVYYALQAIFPGKVNAKLAWLQWGFWLIAIIGIYISYFTGNFGGREYWEFEPIWALPIAISWLLFLIQFFSIVMTHKHWPVYYYMWMTGIVFFLFIFIENYLWLLPYFNKSLIKDMTIQWKVNGSMVGAWNQILYGISFFLMDKISGDRKVGYSKIAFTMYFIGFFNLLFNWGHHIYTLPSLPYIRYIGYAVSMTEWIFFARTIYLWKHELINYHKHYAYFPYRFIMAANFWVFVNLTLALFMSIPAFNIYTHGTHVTVAHAMGTTIGINTMIILAATFNFQGKELEKGDGFLTQNYWILQIGLFILWVALLGAGLEKGIWQMQATRTLFAEMMAHLKPWFVLFFVGGLLTTLGILGLVIKLFKTQISVTRSHQNRNT